MERYSGIWLPRFRLALTHPLFETPFHLPLSETPLYPFFFFSFFSLFNRYLFSSLLSLSISFGRNVCFGVDEPEGSKKTLSSRGLLVVPEADELVFTDLLRAMPPPPLPPSPSRLNERLTRGLRMLQLVSSWILGQ